MADSTDGKEYGIDFRLSDQSRERLRAMNERITVYPPKREHPTITVYPPPKPQRLA